MNYFLKKVLGICLALMLLMSGCSLGLVDLDATGAEVSDLGNAEINSKHFSYKFLADIDTVDNIAVYFQNLPQKWNEALWVALENWNEIPKCKVEFLYATSPTNADVIVKTGTVSGATKASTAWALYPPSQGVPGKSITILTSFDIMADWGVNYEILTNNDVWTLKNGTVADLRLLREAVMMHELGHILGFMHTDKKEGDVIEGVSTDLTIYSIMSSVRSMSQVDTLKFSADDILAAQRLFPDDSVPHMRIYEHSNYTGRSKVIFQHESWPNLSSNGFNDIISSVRVYGGAKFKAFENKDNGGRKLIIENNISNMSNVGFNDIISSITWAERKVALKSALNGRYARVAYDEPNNPLYCDRTSIREWETLSLINLDNGHVALRGYNGQYVCAENEGDSRAVCNRDAVLQWETFDFIDYYSTGMFSFRTHRLDWSHYNYLRSDSFASGNVNMGTGCLFYVIDLP